jgi:hypothetical protein
MRPNGNDQLAALARNRPAAWRKRMVRVPMPARPQPVAVSNTVAFSWGVLIGTVLSSAAFSLVLLLAWW